MKKKFISLLILPTLLLSSCSWFQIQSFKDDVFVYDIDTIEDGDALAKAFQISLEARFIKNQPAVPYLTISQYASLYDDHMEEGFKNTVEKNGYSTVWKVEKNDELYFVSEINYLFGTIGVNGSLEATFKSGDDPRDLKALDYGLESNGEHEYLSDRTYSYYSYADYGFKTFTYEGERYFPLGLLDITFSDHSGIYFTYNYKHIFSTHDVDNYKTKKYRENSAELTFNSQMKASKSYSSMPEYLREYNAYLFLYLMDYFYGLKSTRNISSMSKLYKNNYRSIYTALFSSNDKDRVYAYSDALSVLDDHHTILYDVNDTWSDGNYLPTRRYGQGCYNRSVLNGTLTGYRDAAYNRIAIDYRTAKPGKDIIYSQDGKTAMFAFDGFEFGKSNEVFNEDGSIKDSAGEYDTYFKLIDIFNTIKNKGGVQNVILDISLNGGGVVGVMMKLLALISKKNSSGFAFYDDNSSVASIYTSRCDSNFDGEYTESDSFGSQFNLYILTSDCSFSCGNAFPCIAQLEGSAKIIGQKSGGGECAVSIHYLPNSEYVYHSSNLHLGYFNKSQKSFLGFENGATPDIEVAINQNFYSIENLNNAIKNA